MIGRVWLRLKEGAGFLVGLPIGLALGVWYRWENRREK